jgi:hypothetical protein
LLSLLYGWVQTSLELNLHVFCFSDVLCWAITNAPVNDFNMLGRWKQNKKSVHNGRYFGASAASSCDQSEGKH